MSRVGKKPIDVPAGLKVAIQGRTITVAKDKKSLEYTFEPDVAAEWDEAARRITVTRKGDESRRRALHGLTRALIQNMVTGVSVGFAKKMQIVGVGYNIKMQGSKIMLSVGYNAPVEMEIPTGLEVAIENPTNFIIKGFDKHLLGQFAAEVRSIRPPEPYKGKGIRYIDEYVRRKVGKALAAGG